MDPCFFMHVGMRCIELGAGVGLVGLALAAMGAHVTITDVAKVLPLMQANLAANGYQPGRR
jgi:tRNA1(Val) A37 N6-methylase TrmN6